MDGVILDIVWSKVVSLLYQKEKGKKVVFIQKIVSLLLLLLF